MVPTSCDHVPAISNQPDRQRAHKSYTSAPENDCYLVQTLFTARMAVAARREQSLGPYVLGNKHETAHKRIENGGWSRTELS